MEPEIKHTDTSVFSSQDVELCLWFRSSLINDVLLLGQGRKENTQIHTLYLFDFTENVYIQLFYCKWGTCGIHICRGETDGAVSPCMCPRRLWSLRYTKNWRFGDSVYIIHSWKIPESSTSEFLQVWSTNHLPRNLLGCLLKCRPLASVSSTALPSLILGQWRVPSRQGGSWSNKCYSVTLGTEGCASGHDYFIDKCKFILDLSGF